MRGLVIKNTGSWYQVRTDDGQFIECKIKGNFRLKGIRSTNPVAVGDRVQIILNQEGTAFINEIEDRKNYILRRSSNLSKQSHILAANLDQCMLVVTINYPETSTIFIDRFLASAEAYRIPVKLVFNKVDAYDEDELHYLDSLINLYTHIGYPCFKISAKSKQGIDAIQKELEEILEASRIPMEQRDAVRKMGSRFVKTIEKLDLEINETGIYKEYVTARKGKNISHSCVYGVFCSALGIELEEALEHYLYAQTSAMVTNCVKTIPLSQSVGQKLLSRCFFEFQEVLETLKTQTKEELCLSAPGFDIRGIQHEKLYSRLYMS